MDIDPANVQAIQWERDEPTYHVYFWKRGPEHPGIPPEKIAYYASESEISGARDVVEVLEWAKANAGPDRTYTVYVVADGRTDDAGVLRVFGTDPTRALS